MAFSMPSWGDHDDHGRHRHRHHRDHHQDNYRSEYRGDYRHSPCRMEGWYDRAGYYHERRICRESRVSIPGPAVYVQPPSLFIQPPGIYLR